MPPATCKIARARGRLPPRTPGAIPSAAGRGAEHAPGPAVGCNIARGLCPAAAARPGADHGDGVSPVHFRRGGRRPGVPRRPTRNSSNLACRGRPRRHAPAQTRPLSITGAFMWACSAPGHTAAAGRSMHKRPGAENADGGAPVHLRRRARRRGVPLRFHRGAPKTQDIQRKTQTGKVQNTESDRKKAKENENFLERI